MAWRAALIATALVVCSTTARADPGRVVLSDPSPALAEAVRDALEPWGITVAIVSGADSPGPTMPQNAARARAIATSHDANAVVWVAGSGVDYAVWVYDAEADQVVSRALNVAPPFDEATAAAVGLKVRRLLRHAEVAPPAEKFGASATAAGRGARPSRLWFQATGGVRSRPTEASDLEPRLGLGLAIFSRAIEPFGAQILLRTGPGVSVSDSAFVGHFSDLAVSASVVARLRLLDTLIAAPSVGASAHFTHLDGIVTASQRTPNVDRVNLHLEVGGQLAWAVSDDLHIGLRVDAAYAARRQTYLVGGVPVLDLPSVEAEGAIVLNLPFL